MESVENRFGLPNYVGEGILALMVFSIIATIVAILLDYRGHQHERREILLYHRN